MKISSFFFLNFISKKKIFLFNFFFIWFSFHLTVADFSMALASHKSRSRTKVLICKIKNYLRCNQHKHCIRFVLS